MSTDHQEFQLIIKNFNRSSCISFDHHRMTLAIWHRRNSRHHQSCWARTTYIITYVSSYFKPILFSIGHHILLSFQQHASIASYVPGYFQSIHRLLHTYQVIFSRSSWKKVISVDHTETKLFQLIILNFNPNKLVLINLDVPFFLVQYCPAFSSIHGYLFSSSGVDKHL